METAFDIYNFSIIIIYKTSDMKTWMPLSSLTAASTPEELDTSS